MALDPLAIATRGYLEDDALAIAVRGYLDSVPVSGVELQSSLFGIGFLADEERLSALQLGMLGSGQFGLSPLDIEKLLSLGLQGEGFLDTRGMVQVEFQGMTLNVYIMRTKTFEVER